MVGSPGTPGLEGQVQNLQTPAPGCGNQWPGLHWGALRSHSETLGYQLQDPTGWLNIHE